jgi:hypothetical protein
MRLEQLSKLYINDMYIFSPEDGHKTETCSGY